MKTLVIPKRRVVLVDDESGLLDLYHHILGDIYQISTFDSPQKFLDSLVSKDSMPFDILITDLSMPGINGIEMIREANKKGFYFPSIILSGYLDKSSMFQAVDLALKSEHLLAQSKCFIAPACGGQ